ncbi:MAG TPA: histidine kinase [Rhizomicrobium sp.]|jgi:two-component system LytT family sensor kinase|nr:histidine kinase [Rhizomicrobium sp.]
MTAFQPGPPFAAMRAPAADETPHVETRLAIGSILGFWVFYYVLNTARMAFVPSDPQLDALPRRAAVTVVGIALTLVMYAILRRLEGRSMRVLLTTAFLAAIPAAFAYAYVNFTAFYVVARTSSMMQELHDMRAKHESVMSVITESAVSWYFFIAAWGVLYVALSYAARVQGAERRAAAYRSEAQLAQLRALRYQINPHFLFNTLNSLSTLVLKQRTVEAERMIMNLSHFFRTSLTSDPAADVALSDEIGMQQLYLDIEKIRFPDRLAVQVDVPEDLEDARVPGMILQPLVENAIKHGVAKSNRPVTVTIRARANGGSFHLTVEDDADAGLRFPKPNGVGLANVRDRLATRFDGAASIAFGPREGGGFRADLTLPLLRDLA